MANGNPVLDQPVGIIGTGVAGLINAHVLLQDGFTDVTLISRDKSVGGTWARERVYPGLHINKCVRFPICRRSPQRRANLMHLEQCPRRI